MLDWLPSRRPTDLGDLFDRLVRAFASLEDPKLVRVLPDNSPIVLTAGSVGTLVPHGCRNAPSMVTAQVIGAGPSSAVVTVGQKTATHVRLYSTATATVELVVWI